MSLTTNSFKLLILLSAILSFNTTHIFAASFDHDHKDHNQLFESNVKDGLANYKSIKEKPESLNSYLDTLEKVDEPSFNTWSEKQKLTYLINLYNAATVKLVVDNYPVKSIKDIDREGEGPWKLELVNLFGKKISSDHLEHEIIRKNYKEPRIHFALVCDAIGCPTFQMNHLYLLSWKNNLLTVQDCFFLKKIKMPLIKIKKSFIYHLYLTGLHLILRIILGQ